MPRANRPDPLMTQQLLRRRQPFRPTFWIKRLSFPGASGERVGVLTGEVEFSFERLIPRRVELAPPLGCLVCCSFLAGNTCPKRWPNCGPSRFV